MATCKACGAAIIWARTTTGKAMPLDALPVDASQVEGTCILDDNGVAHFGAIDAPHADAHYVSHFATCPSAARFRRPRT